MTQSDPIWTVNPDDPRAPPRDVWARMTPEARARLVASLPSEFPVDQAHPPEGDRHIDAWTGARQTLRRWFRDRGRQIYVGGNLPVYYPGEPMFSPDVIAVLDVDAHARDSWIVSNEGDRGLDFALEVIVSGNRRKDLQSNPIRYARLGIREYFVFDVRPTLVGYRLPSGGDAYQRLMPQAGQFHSEVLDLDLSIEHGRLRFSLGSAPVPGIEELVSKLESLLNDAEARDRELESRTFELESALEQEQRKREEEQRKREEEQRKREEEQRKREEEQRKREEVDKENAALRSEIERLKQRT